MKGVGTVWRQDGLPAAFDRPCSIVLKVRIQFHLMSSYSDQLVFFLPSIQPITNYSSDALGSSLLVLPLRTALPLLSLLLTLPHHAQRLRRPHQTLLQPA